MTPKQKRRLIRSSKRGNPLLVIRSRVFSKMFDRALDQWVSGMASYQETMRALQREIIDGVTRIMVRKVIGSFVAPLVSGLSKGRA